MLFHLQLTLQTLTNWFQLCVSVVAAMGSGLLLGAGLGLQTQLI